MDLSTPEKINSIKNAYRDVIETLWYQSEYAAIESDARELLAALADFRDKWLNARCKDYKNSNIMKSAMVLSSTLCNQDQQLIMLHRVLGEMRQPSA